MTDIELRKLAWEFRKSMIGRKSGRLRCLTISRPLRDHLHKHKIKCTLIRGAVCYYRCWIGHFWLELEDGRILDVTAEQFATKAWKGQKPRPMPKVFIGRKPRWYKAWNGQ